MNVLGGAALGAANVQLVHHLALTSSQVVNDIAVDAMNKVVPVVPQWGGPNRARDAAASQRIAAARNALNLLFSEAYDCEQFPFEDAHFQQRFSEGLRDAISKWGGNRMYYLIAPTFFLEGQYPSNWPIDSMYTMRAAKNRFRAAPPPEEPFGMKGEYRHLTDMVASASVSLGQF